MGKKKGKKDKKPKRQPALNELETLTYEQQITENNRQLARLRTRNVELEAEAEKLKDKLQMLEESKVDLTSYLEEVLQKKSQEAQELAERVKALENLRHQEQKDFKKKEDLLDQEFKMMEKNLTAEIKLAAGKLNALEDWRLARIDLMKKFEEQERQMAEQEVRHKETLYETEKKFITGKAKMQSELERRIAELADKFRRATGLRLAEATQRAVRENLALRRELDLLLGECLELDASVRECQERERDARLRAELHEAEARIALNKVVKQRRAMERLLAEDVRASHEASRLLKAEQWARYAEKAGETYGRAEAELARKIAELEKEARAGRERSTEEARQAIQNRDQLSKLEDVLQRARAAVVRALEVHRELGCEDEEENVALPDSCSDCLIEAKEELLSTLHEILMGYSAPRYDDDADAMRESKVGESLYTFGHLGLIPTLPETRTTTTTEFGISCVEAHEGKEEPDSTTTQCSGTYSNYTSGTRLAGD